MSCHDDELQPPCLEALLAGTFALMTCWASPAARDPVATNSQRQLMARKIVSNLFFLKSHPHASPGLRQVMTRAHARWVPLMNDGDSHQDASTHQAQDAETIPGMLAAHQRLH